MPSPRARSSSAARCCCSSSPIPVARALAGAFVDESGRFSLAALAARIANERDLGPGVPGRRRALRRRLEHALPRPADRGRDDSARHADRAPRRARRGAAEAPAQRARAAADHHAAVRRRPRPDPAVRPRRHRQPAPRAAFGITPSRWFYGLFGIWLAQLFAFTPIAFMIVRGVVAGIGPSLEEAAQTLRADRRTMFLTVTLPLLKPASRTRSWSASSRASPTSATRSSSAASSRCSRPRSSSPSSARSSTRAGRRRWR